MLASGETIQAGGATVKFSAGYGLTHAMWGSGGRLGALAAVSLRLRQAVAGEPAVPKAGPTLAQVLESPYEVRLRNCPRAGASLSGRPWLPDCREPSVPTPPAR